MRRPRRRTHTDATPVEWAWLTAAPDANPFVGLVGGSLDARLAELWATHAEEIRALWRAKSPEKLPPCHPAEKEFAE